MKKLFLVATMCVAGLASAKDGDVKKVSKDDKLEIKEESTDSKSDAVQDCYSYGIVIGCTNEMVVDTACGDSYAEAQQCMNHNAALMNEFFCGN